MTLKGCIYGMSHAARVSATTERENPAKQFGRDPSPAQASALVLLTDLTPNGLFDGESLLSLTRRWIRGNLRGPISWGAKKLNTLPILIERMPLFSAVGRRHMQDGFADVVNRPACAARLNWNNSLPSEHLDY